MKTTKWYYETHVLEERSREKLTSASWSSLGSGSGMAMGYTYSETGLVRPLLPRMVTWTPFCQTPATAASLLMEARVFKIAGLLSPHHHQQHDHDEIAT